MLRLARRLCIAPLLLIGCLAMTSLHVSAAESMLSLTMAKLDFRAERRGPASRFSETQLVERAQHVEVFLPRRNEILSLPKTLILEKPAPQEKHSPLQITRRSARGNEDAKLWASASIQAGYGEIYSDKTSAIYGHNGTRWEEPSCGYIKIRFRF